jgi:putative exporter of polyketide antibiotics
MVPAFDAVRGLSYFTLTGGHRPLAGAWDWPSVGVLAAAVAVLLVIGIEVFARRDLLVPSGGRFKVPPLRLWVLGPFTRGLGERFPAALAWGALLGVFGLIIASSADQFVALLQSIPQMQDMIERIFPGQDILSAGGFLQVAFFQEGIIIVGLAASVFVSGWASDENERRLEVVLGTPIGRAAWTLRSGASVFGAVGVTAGILMIGVAAGAAVEGEDPLGPALGVAVLGLYGMGLAGVGLAVGGLVRPSLAGPVTLALGLGSYLWDLVGSILRWPAAVLDLALNRHLGRPMIGDPDVGGLVLCVAIAIGGLLLCAFGMRRRDVGR